MLIDKWNDVALDKKGRQFRYTVMQFVNPIKGSKDMYIDFFFQYKSVLRPTLSELIDGVTELMDK